MASSAASRKRSREDNRDASDSNSDGTGEYTATSPAYTPLSPAYGYPHEPYPQDPFARSTPLNDNTDDDDAVELEAPPVTPVGVDDSDVSYIPAAASAAGPAAPAAAGPAAVAVAGPAASSAAGPAAASVAGPAAPPPSKAAPEALAVITINSLPLTEVPKSHVKMTRYSISDANRFFASQYALANVAEAYALLKYRVATDSALFKHHHRTFARFLLDGSSPLGFEWTPMCGKVLGLATCSDKVLHDLGECVLLGLRELGEVTLKQLTVLSSVMLSIEIKYPDLAKLVTPFETKLRAVLTESMSFGALVHTIQGQESKSAGGGGDGVIDDPCLICSTAQFHLKKRGVITPCGHGQFHYECLETKMSLLKGKCPVCRGPLNDIVRLFV
jgi:hypothetical protein